MAIVSLKKLTKRYGNMEIVHGIDLDVADREFIALVGPSGCGKSTTLRMIAGLEDISGGTIEIGDRIVNDLPPRSRNISMVFQSYALYPHMTVRENLGFSLKIAGAPKEEMDRRVAEASAILGLDALLERRPSQLSGGQRQRVAMGRAIVRDPDVFLFDEPLSNLDAKLRTQMRTEIKKLHAKVKSTVIYVTHDQVEAMTLADRIVIMRDGGKIVFSGGQSLPLPGRFKAKVNAGDKVVFGLRPDDLYPVGHGLHSGDAADVHEIELPVTVTEPLGNETLVFAEFDRRDWVSRMLNPRPLRAGDRVAMSFDLSQAHLFSAETGKSLRA
ncbi:MAG: ATP-binding cassette domain-containing protein [Mesorhizobium sp.]|uniref:ABC transporter ATP-binding protein n=1 Tax=Mesorhizobium sp. TaxID=1871066 RepID=UPI001219726B|nr:ATP-binding cassette domain-containing protein [Mesorhizobium sp.]TIR24373.1 MAG: ATP-binding cassette domain-containing protein [Mesorhizobium sp.]